MEKVQDTTPGWQKGANCISDRGGGGHCCRIHRFQFSVSLIVCIDFRALQYYCFTLRKENVLLLFIQKFKNAKHTEKYRDEIQ